MDDPPLAHMCVDDAASTAVVTAGAGDNGLSVAVHRAGRFVNGFRHAEASPVITAPVLSWRVFASNHIVDIESSVIA
jgi:hypothetical protein